MTSIKYLVFLSAVVLLCSCLRYVPSRSEIQASHAKEGVPLAEYAGEEAFHSLEKEQNKRLESLVAERVSEKTAQEDPSYHIGIGDVLEFDVFDVQELNRKVRVRPSGHISLPLIGQIPVVGKTEAEVQEEVANRLKKYVYSPQVQMFIAEYSANKVWVVGEIYKPGAYSLIRDNYSLLELLSEAGGRKERAGSLIVLIPGDPNQNTRAPQDVISSRARMAPDASRNGIEIPFDSLVGAIDTPPLFVPLQPGDTIVVPEAGMVQVDGEVQSPGSFPLSSRMTLLGAIASSGGLTYSADVKEVEVVRELGSGKKALITVDLEEIAFRDGNDIRLRNGDIVRVPSHGARFATRQTINVFNSFLGRFIP